MYDTPSQPKISAIQSILHFMREIEPGLTPSESLMYRAVWARTHRHGHNIPQPISYKDFCDGVPSTMDFLGVPAVSFSRSYFHKTRATLVEKRLVCYVENKYSIAAYGPKKATATGCSDVSSRRHFGVPIYNINIICNAIRARARGGQKAGYQNMKTVQDAIEHTKQKRDRYFDKIKKRAPTRITDAARVFKEQWTSSLRESFPDAVTFAFTNRHTKNIKDWCRVLQEHDIEIDKFVDWMIAGWESRRRTKNFRSSAGYPDAPVFNYAFVCRDTLTNMYVSFEKDDSSLSDVSVGDTHFTRRKLRSARNKIAESNKQKYKVTADAAQAAMVASNKIKRLEDELRKTQRENQRLRRKGKSSKTNKPSNTPKSVIPNWD